MASSDTDDNIIISNTFVT